MSLSEEDRKILEAMEDEDRPRVTTEPIDHQAAWIEFDGATPHYVIQHARRAIRVNRETYLDVLATIQATALQELSHCISPALDDGLEESIPSKIEAIAKALRQRKRK